MIEINLIPDVKLQLIRARRTRTQVVTIAILLAATSVGLVILLSVYAFGALGVANFTADKAIENENKKLTSVQDLSKTLTIQNQIKLLSAMHNDKIITSRMFEVISTVVPPESNINTIATKRLSLDTEENIITIEGEASNGYEALEVFKKTIDKTMFQYSENGEKQTPIKIAEDIVDGDRRYSENSDGQRVLRFTLQFAYPEQLFSPEATNGRIVAPNKQNATDSAVGVPKSLFTGKTDDTGGLE